MRFSSLFFFSVFNQGEEGTSWYIIQKGSVNVVIYGKVCISATSVGRGGIICNKHGANWYYPPWRHQ